MQYQSENRLDDDFAKILSIISYITILGWLVAAFLYGHHKSSLARFHLRDSLGLIITTSILLLIPLVGWFLFIGLITIWCVGFYNAINGQRQALPIFGLFFQKYLDFIH